MKCYFVKLRRSADAGWEPDLPSNEGFLEVGDPGRRPKWGVYSVSIDPDLAVAAGLEPVPASLAVLLQSAERYPPALALSRDDLKRQFSDHVPKRAEFVARWESSLHRHLRRQHRAPYVLAEARVDKVGYLTAGEFYWIVAFRAASRTVLWVSDDYFVYQNPVTHFRLTRGQLERLSSRA